MITSKQNNTAIGNIRLFGNVRVMIISGLFIAMSIILGKFLQIPIGNSIRISFENLPLIMAGIFFGPFVGGAVGVGADLIGCLLKGYAINPIITLGALCIGALPGVISMLMTKKNQLLSMCLSAFAGHIIGSMLIKSIGLHIYYGTPFEVLIMRVPLYLTIGTLESMIIYILLKNKAFSAQLDKVCNYGNKL
ncbi:MAG: folate family ECF transporter S component [Ruminococcus sp.]|nr:folate family ECF transporter S component [Ruminococcus sp.]